MSTRIKTRPWKPTEFFCYATREQTGVQVVYRKLQDVHGMPGTISGLILRFSQFTTALIAVSVMVTTSDVRSVTASCVGLVVQLVGSMSMAARYTAINKFKEDPYCRVFLMNLKAGGVALNLTIISHVFVIDPWWNPAVERQAQGRIHRIGQYKPIRIVRFIIENTFEERILRLQKKKELVFEGTVGGS